MWLDGWERCGSVWVWARTATTVRASLSVASTSQVPRQTDLPSGYGMYGQKCCVQVHQRKHHQPGRASSTTTDPTDEKKKKKKMMKKDEERGPC